MRNLNILFIALVFLSWVTNANSWGPNYKDPYVREACSVTRYQDLCIHSLSSFSRVARHSPNKWARAGVSVTLSEVKNVNLYLKKLANSRSLRGKNKLALLDCLELFQDAIDSLHKSLGVLRRLNATNFETQMEDLTTWMSSVITDEDTCQDGFDLQNQKEVKLLKNKVLRVTYFTSNGLALINKLAANGLGVLNGT